MLRQPASHTARIDACLPPAMPRKLTTITNDTNTPKKDVYRRQKKRNVGMRTAFATIFAGFKLRDFQAHEFPCQTSAAENRADVKTLPSNRGLRQIRFAEVASPAQDHADCQTMAASSFRQS